MFTGGVIASVVMIKGVRCFVATFASKEGRNQLAGRLGGKKQVFFEPSSTFVRYFRCGCGFVPVVNSKTKPKTGNRVLRHVTLHPSSEPPTFDVTNDR